MEISREAILDKTHYGLKIYAYVLRQYYPNQTVLSVKGRDCGICLLYTSPSPRDQRGSRMPSSA